MGKYSGLSNCSTCIYLHQLKIYRRDVNNKNAAKGPVIDINKYFYEKVDCCTALFENEGGPIVETSINDICECYKGKKQSELNLLDSKNMCEE